MRSRSNRIVHARSLLIAGLTLAAAVARAETRLDMSIGGRTSPQSHDGRTEWVYQWPAVYFEAHFRGEKVSLEFDDSSNCLNVIVDGRLMIVKKPGRTTMKLDHLGLVFPALGRTGCRNHPNIHDDVHLVITDHPMSPMSVRTRSHDARGIAGMATR